MINFGKKVGILQKYVLLKTGEFCEKHGIFWEKHGILDVLLKNTEFFIKHGIF